RAYPPRLPWGRVPQGRTTFRRHPRLPRIRRAADCGRAPREESPQAPAATSAKGGSPAAVVVSWPAPGAGRVADADPDSASECEILAEIDPAHVGIGDDLARLALRENLALMHDVGAVDDIEG